MEIIKTVAEMMGKTAGWRVTGKKIGLVPTMGFLHEGHLSLVKRARVENDLVVVSIFVNPLQFGPKEDFGRYPRDLERDLKLLEGEGVDAVYNPSPDEMYPPGFNAGVEVQGITDVLEGGHRPGHFRGVTTVVAKLFNAVGPQAAYFGQKDAQQVAVIKKMVRDLNFPLQIVVCPTVREPDGLALSSRNVYLNPEERKAALCLSKALTAAAELWNTAGRDGEALRDAMQAILQAEPLARPDYVSAADPETLREYQGEIGTDKGVLLSMAVRIGNTRLIDNFLLNP
jgi:pantoate--beta-alanine ligase